MPALQHQGAATSRETMVQIDRVTLRTVRGTMETEGPFWEERLLRPIDIYDEFRHQGPLLLGYQSRAEQTDAHHYRLEASFVRIDTDEGVHGIAGPIAPSISPASTTRRSIASPK